MIYSSFHFLQTLYLTCILCIIIILLVHIVLIFQSLSQALDQFSLDTCAFQAFVCQGSLKICHTHLAHFLHLEALRGLCTIAINNGPSGPFSLLLFPIFGILILWLSLVRLACFCIFFCNGCIKTRNLREVSLLGIALQEHKSDEA